MPMSVSDGEWQGVKTAYPALHRVEWGRQGLDPRHLLSPPRALPTFTEIPNPHQAALRSPGLVLWAGPGVGRRKGFRTTGSQGLQSRSPCKWVDPRSSALRRRLGQMF